MKRSRFLGWAMTAVIALGSWCHADKEDPKIAQLINDIDQASEKGDYSRIQLLRSRLADYAADVKRYDFATQQYELLLAGRPRKADRIRYFVRLGHVRYALGDYSRAIQAYEDALHDNPKEWEANLERARTFATAELNINAIEAYKRCIELRRKEAAPYEEIAKVYQRQGFPGKAIVYYEKSLALQPKPEVYLGIADAYVQADDLTQATHTLEQAKTLLPRADYDIRLGDIFKRQGDLAKAGAAWEEALMRDAKRDDVRLKLMMLYDRLNRRSDTDRLFKELLTAYPSSPLVHHLRALVLWERGDRAGSRSEALMVQRMAPTELVAHYNERLLELLQKKS